MKTALIAAIGPNNELGYQGDLPWRIKEDLQYFKKVTTGAAVIMGRKTWDSIPGQKGLPGRINIVLTSKPKGTLYVASVLHKHKVLVPQCKTIEAALLEVRKLGIANVFFIGGASVYEQVLHTVDEIYLTLVEKMSEPIKADTFFPEFDITEFEQVSEETYFTVEYTVTNLVLAKKTDGKRSNRKPGGMADKPSGRSGRGGNTGAIHWQGAGHVPGGKSTGVITPRGY